MRERGLGPTEEAAPDVVTIPLGEQGALAAARAAAILRAAGVSVRNGLPGRSMKAAMRGAGASGARYALIVGDSEAEAGTVVLKPLRGEEEQRTVAIDDLGAWDAATATVGL